MKKVFLFYLLFIVIFTVDTWSRDIIKVLAIGNSFSVDAIEDYLYELGQSEEITFIIGNLYIGGCSLEKHWLNVENDKSEYSYRKINTTGNKITTPEISLLQGITDEYWDYISFQQNSSNSGIYESYFPYLPQLVDFVKKHATNPDVKIIFHQTWAYAKDSPNKMFAIYHNNQEYMYASLVKASRRAGRKVGIKIFVPSGTAIQNARNSFIGDNFCRDGYHLSYGLGRYTAACTWFEVLSGTTVVGNSFIPPSITPLEAVTVQRAAHKAVLRPFSITPIRIGVNYH